MRRVWGRAASSSSCCRARPRGASASAKPALITTTARVPRFASAATRPGTTSGGVAITARSGVTGRLATSGYASTPSIAWYFGFTGMTGPWKPERSRLRARVAPTEPGVRLAPTSATERGSNIGSRLRIDIVRVVGSGPRLS